VAEQLAETQEQVDAALPTAIEAPPSLDARVMEAVRGCRPRGRQDASPFPRASVRQRLSLATAAFGLMVASFAAGSWYTARHLPGAGGSASAGVDTTRQRPPPIPDDRITRDQNVGPAAVGAGAEPLLPFPVGVVDLHSDGMQLRGGSKANMHGVPVAALRYAWKGQPISCSRWRAARFHRRRCGRSYSGGQLFCEKDGRSHLRRLVFRRNELRDGRPGRADAPPVSTGVSYQRKAGGCMSR